VIAIVAALLFVAARRRGGDSSESPPEVNEMATVDTGECLSYDEDHSEGGGYFIEYLNPVSDSCDANTFGEAFSDAGEEGFPSLR
jgi:hypothetical protein